MKKINDYEIIDHGVEYSNYFQGCGISFTQYKDIATGIGHSAYEAIDDALELLAQNYWDTKSNLDLIEEARKMGKTKIIPQEDLWYHVSVRVK